MSTEYVHVGAHADLLASGRLVTNGERVTDADLHLAHAEQRGEDQHLLEEGHLRPMSDFAGAKGPSHKELQARAAELEIEGRSKLSADELREAIANREAEEGHLAS